MTQLKTEDVVWLEDNEILLFEYLQEKYETSFDHQEYMEYFLKNPTLAKLTRTILEDFKKTNDEKLIELGPRLFAQPKVIIINGDPGEGKGTTSASTFVFYENYIKKTLKKKIVALMPCPYLPFVDLYVWSINDVPNDSIIYSTELGIHFPNTDYDSKDSKSVNPIMVKIRQELNGVMWGETQTDSIVHIGFYKFLSTEIFRYQNPMKASFKRDRFTNSNEINIYNELLKLMLPPTAKKPQGGVILENTTKIILFDDQGFMSVHIPRTDIYTHDMSIGFKNWTEMLDKYILEKLKQEFQLKAIIAYLEKKFQYTKSPIEWKTFFKKHNITLKTVDLPAIYQKLV